MLKTLILSAAAISLTSEALAEDSNQYTVGCDPTIVECPKTVSAADLAGIEPALVTIEGTEYAVYQIDVGIALVPLFDSNFLGLGDAG